MHDKHVKKIVVVVFVALIIASTFVLDIDWTNEVAYKLYHSYFADIVLPFMLYLLLVPNTERYRLIARWWQRALAVFVLCTTSEILQYLGIFAFVRVFDPLDIVMYGLGVLLAAWVDRLLFTRVFPFWD
jgi:hypothetical protein